MTVQQGQRVDYEVLAVGDERPEQNVHLRGARARCVMLGRCGVLGRCGMAVMVG